MSDAISSWFTGVVSTVGGVFDTLSQATTTVSQSISQISIPSMPAMPSIPSMPDLTMPAMPAMPDLTMPAMPDLTMPAIPDLTMPAMPDLTMPAIPDLTMPAMPVVTLPPLPEVSLPTMSFPEVSLPTVNWEAPQVTVPTTDDMMSGLSKVQGWMSQGTDDAKKFLENVYGNIVATTTGVVTSTTAPSDAAAATATDASGGGDVAMEVNIQGDGISDEYVDLDTEGDIIANVGGPLVPTPVPVLPVPAELKICIKLLVLGDSQSGKSALLNRWAYGRYNNVYKPTTGADFVAKEVQVNNTKVNVQIWDTSGQEHFQSLGTAFYRGSDAVVIVCDVTRASTVDHLDKWREDFFKFGKPQNPSKVPFLVLANKTDDPPESDSVNRRVEAWASSNDLPCHFVSAKNGTGLDEAFLKFINKVVQGKV